MTTDLDEKKAMIPPWARYGVNVFFAVWSATVYVAIAFLAQVLVELVLEDVFFAIILTIFFVPIMGLILFVLYYAVDKITRFEDIKNNNIKIVFKHALPAITYLLINHYATSNETGILQSIIAIAVTSSIISVFDKAIVKLDKHTPKKTKTKTPQQPSTTKNVEETKKTQERQE